MTKFEISWHTVLRTKDAVQDLRTRIHGKHIAALDRELGCEALSPETLSEKSTNDADGRMFQEAKGLYDKVVGLGDSYFDKDDDVFVIFDGDCGPRDASQKRRMRAAVLRTRSRAVDIVDASLDDDTLRYRLKRAR